MKARDIIVIGGSAGAIAGLRQMVGGFPADLPAAIFIVVHTSPESRGILPLVLTNAGALSAENATDRAPIRSGRIYVAPPDRHLLIKRGHVRVTRGPRENGFRPAVDPLFRTDAAAYGPQVIGIILSGGRDDGVLGLSHIKRRGGVVIAQDPGDAEAPSMPESAIRQVAVDHVLRADEMASLIAELSRESIEEGIVTTNDRPPDDVAEAGDDALDTATLPGPPSPFTCPECGGALWELRDGKLLRYQCHVGHGYSTESLVAAHTDGLESALWTALRTLEESAAFRRRMAHHARERGMSAIAEAYEEHAQDSEARARIVRRALVTDAPGGRTQAGSVEG